jgi:hypothetical protein
MHTTALTTPAAVEGAITSQQLRARLALIQDAMRTVMVEGVDYGKIPGTDKPTLMKPGAEKICVLLRLSAGEPEVLDLSTHDEVRYRLRVPIVSAAGEILGVGVGECSSSEEKYRWRQPVYQSKEWEETAEDRRREVWKRKGGSASKQKQVRTNPADVGNTVLKMGHKRAFLHGVLLATAASSVFTHDLEDMSEELRASVTGTDEPTEPSEPKRTSSTGAPPAANGGAAAAPTAPATKDAGIDILRGVQFLDSKYVAASLDGKVKAHYTIATSQGEVCTPDQQLYREAESCEGSAHRFDLHTRLTRRGDGKRVRLLLQINPIPESAPAAAAPAAQPSEADSATTSAAGDTPEQGGLLS